MNEVFDLNILAGTNDVNGSDINLIEGIEKNTTIKNKFIENYNSEEYRKYLLLIENHFNEMKKVKFNNKFNYFVNNEGHFVKESKEKNYSKENYIIYRPKYLDITNTLKKLEKDIHINESNLRFIRTSLLQGKQKNTEFDKVKKDLLEQIDKRNILLEVKKFYLDSKKNYNDDIIKSKLVQNNLLLQIVEAKRNLEFEMTTKLIK